MRITMIDITIISSIRVKPRRAVRNLPFGIRRAIGILFRALRKHVKYILTSPPGTLGIVLHRMHTPFAAACEWVDGNAAQEPHLSIRRIARTLDALDQRLECF